MTDLTTRDRIVSAADDLFYQQGFASTSFSDIADIVQISRGNFYYHFKTKDEILDAVIAFRLEKTREMLTEWELHDADPGGRIKCFIGILIANRAKIVLYGCPVGALSLELARLDHLSLKAANRIFTLFQKWLSKQFQELGRHEDANSLALHLLARSQGVATLAAAFKDKTFIDKEVAVLNDWLEMEIERASD